MQKLWFVLGCLALCGAFVAPIHAAVGDSTTVVAVEVPVQVTVDGEPLRGLQKEDFVLLEGRKEQKILDFEVVDLGLIDVVDPVTDPTRVEVDAGPVPLPIHARRHFLILFDMSFSTPDAIVKAREAALEMIDGQLHPTDLVAVATWSTATGVRLLVGFTPDRRQAALAVDTLGAPGLIEVAQDPLGLVFGELVDAERAASSGRGGNAVVDTLQDFARAIELQDRREESERITDLTRSMGDLARLLGQVPGRKHVVYLSEGFDTSILFGTADRGAQQRMDRAAEQGRIWEIDSEERYGDTNAQGALGTMLESFRRADCTIQAVDIGGLRTLSDVAHGNRRALERQRAGVAGRDDGLAVLAGSTGGEHIRNTNDLGRAMGEVLERTSLTYVLTFQPRKLKLDGEFRRLKVKLRDGPRGARLVHRPGYYAPRAGDEVPALEHRLLAAGRLLDGDEGGSIPLAVVAAPLPSTTGDGAYVPMLVEIDGQALATGARQGLLRGELYVYALDADGSVEGYLRHGMTVDLGQVGSALASSGLKFFGHLDLPAGRYTLRTLLRLADRGAHGVVATPLTVPEFSAGPAILPPLAPETPGRWVMMREAMAEGESPPPYPFMASGQPFIPAAAPRFPRKAEIRWVVATHGLAADARLSARILDPGGREVLSEFDLGQGEEDPGRPGVRRFVLSLDPDGWASGAYTVEVRSGGSSGPNPSPPAAARAAFVLD